MEYWPADQRPINNKQIPIHKSQHLNASTHVKSSAKGPVLYPGNGIAAAAMPRVYRTAIERGTTRLKWDFITYQGPNVRALGKPVVLFPAKSRKNTLVSHISEHRMAEEGARFLRQRYPDVDIPFEIIKESMQEDIAKENAHSKFLSFRNALAMVHLAETSSHDRQTIFAFPMGDLNNELNIARTSWSSSKGTVFTTSADPVAKFDTPLSQIAASGTQNEDSPMLAVQTMSFCSLFSISNSASRKNRYSLPNLKQLASFKASETGTILDMAMSPFTPSQVLLAGESGEVFSMQAGKDDLDILTPGVPSEPDESRNWHVCWTAAPHCFLRASSRKLDLLDSRAHAGSTMGAVTFGPEEHVTAMEGYTSSAQTGEYQVLATTSQRVTWLDTRYLKVPLLSWKHLRSRDSTLRASTCSLGSDNVVLLMSQRNGLISSYGVSSSEGLLRGNEASQIIQTVPSSFRRAGYAFHQNSAPNNTGFNLVELSTQGELVSSYVTLQPSGSDGDHERISMAMDSDGQRETIVPEWSEYLETTETTQSQRLEEPESLSLRESFEVDFETIYQGVMQAATSNLSAEAEIDDVRDMLDRMPRLLQGTDHPVEDIMTTYDVAFDACSEPDQLARSTFLTNTVANSRRANIAFEETRISLPALIGRDACWTFDLSSTIRCIQHLDDISSQKLRAEGDKRHRSDAARQLEMDSALYSHIYSSNPIALSDRYPHDDDSLERATELLSLSEARMPPPLSFSFLKPRPLADTVADVLERPQISTGVVGEVPDASLGTRLLLSEWELGADLQQFAYINPYPDVLTPVLKDKPSRRTTSYVEQNPSQPAERPSPSLELSQIRSAPPKIGISQSRIPIAPSTGNTGRALPKVATKNPVDPALQMRWQSTPSSIGHSQNTITASSQSKFQVGVPKPATKKVKKRMGGF